MRVLTIYAHPNPQSFNHVILDEFSKGLVSGGHAADVVDLYSIKFDPCVTLEDFAQFSGGQLPTDVLAQQEKINQADGIALIHPMWGWSFPAILKGWMDRVFSYGFAYTASEQGLKGLLRDRKGLVISTAGMPEEYYRGMGYFEAFEATCNGIFNVCGINSVEYATFYAVEAVGDQGRRRYLEDAFRLGKDF